MRKHSAIFTILLFLLMAAVGMTGCEQKAENTAPTLGEPGDGSSLENVQVTHYAVIEIENYGKIKAELYGNTAPITVANFVNLAENGFYEGLTFHRIINGFMMQGGAGEGCSPIAGEFTSNGFTNNLKHEAGVLSMDRTNDPNSASSQFFIMHEAAPHLDGDYAAFGKVVEGMDVVDRICTTTPVTDRNGSVPAQAQPVIKSVTILPGDAGFTGTSAPNTEPNATNPPATEPVITGDGDGATLETAVATHIVTIEIENFGTIKAELYGNTAPITVENFVALAESGFYEGLTFHRIINGFMMQGGAGNADSPNVTPIKGEFSANGITNNLLHKRGVLSMARTNVMDSASSQFFIMHQDASHLDGQYAAFGMVTEGWNVLDAICTGVIPSGLNGAIAVTDQPVIVSVTVEAVN